MTSETPSYRLPEGGSFSFVMTIIIMLNDPYLAANFVSELRILLLPYQDTLFNGKTVFELLGFPNNLFERLEKLLHQKFA